MIKNKDKKKDDSWKEDLKDEHGGYLKVFLTFSRPLTGSHLTRCGKLGSRDPTCRAQVSWGHSEFWPHPGLPGPTLSPVPSASTCYNPFSSVLKSYLDSQAHPFLILPLPFRGSRSIGGLPLQDPCSVHKVGPTHLAPLAIQKSCAPALPILGSAPRAQPCPQCSSC